MANRDSNITSLIQQAVKVYHDKIDSNTQPNIGVYAPGRVNLIGEHTDYNNGLVLPMAIDQITVLVGHRRLVNDNNCRLITLSKGVDQSDVTIPIPAPPTREQYENKNARIDITNTTWYRYVMGVVALMNTNMENFQPIGIPSFNVVIATNVPLGGGLSSSAALEVATSYFIDNLCIKTGITLPPLKQQDRALLCQRAEHLYANAPCGIMDQFVCVLAEKNTACYIDCCPSTVDGSYYSDNIPLTIDNDELVILIANCKVKHQVSDGGYELRRDRCYEAARIMGRDSLRDVTDKDIEDHKTKLSEPVTKGPSLYQCAIHVVNEINRTKLAKQVLTDSQYKEFGRLMNESHLSLKDQYLVSCKELDKLVELAQYDTKRVYGSRMTGAGFGGCTVTLLEKTAVNDTIKRIEDGYYKPNNIEPEYYIVTPCSGGGVINITQYM